MTDELTGFLESMHDKGIPLTLVPLTRRPAVDITSLHGWDHTGRLFGLYGAQAGSLYLVRPDGHVLGRWHAPRAATLTAAINRVLHPQPR